MYGIGGYTSTDECFGHIGCGKALIKAANVVVVDFKLLKVLLLTTTVSRSIVSVFFVGKYPTECGKYPRFVLMVAVVEFDGRMTYRRKDHRLALLLVPYFCL